MRDNNLQIGGIGNKQSVTNNPKQKSWQDNIFLYTVIGVIIAVLGFLAAKLFGF